jgi:hypothetical protein
MEYSRCGSGQSVFDVINELRRAGKIPEHCTLGPRVGGQQPDNAVAIVTVRAHEKFYILRQAS